MTIQLNKCRGKNPPEQIRTKMTDPTANWKCILYFEWIHGKYFEWQDIKKILLTFRTPKENNKHLVMYKGINISLGYKKTNNGEICIESWANCPENCLGILYPEECIKLRNDIF